jgi:hypothetical protein
VPITLSQLKRKVGSVTLFGEGDDDPNALHVEYYLVLDETLDQDKAKTEAEQARKEPLTDDEALDVLARRCIRAYSDVGSDRRR